MTLVLYLIPVIPLFLRGALAVWFHREMSEHLSEQASDRETHRTLLVTLAGFSFTGLLGLVALPGALEDRRLAIWYVLLSLVSYLGALNLQGYKARRWHDQVGDALTECGSFALLASVVSFILASDLDLAFRIASAVICGGVWLVDFYIRLRFSCEYLSEIGSARRKEK